MNAALSLQNAMRAAMLARTALTALLGGAHIFDEVPRGEHPPFVAFADIETRDWSVIGEKAHEHIATLLIETNERSRRAAQTIAQEIEAALDMAQLTLDGHRLINLRLVSASISRRKTNDNFGALLRFRAVTEPL
jgi:Protein of unknown function (DUF3168)